MHIAFSPHSLPYSRFTAHRQSAAHARYREEHSYKYFITIVGNAGAANFEAKVLLSLHAHRNIAYLSVGMHTILLHDIHLHHFYTRTKIYVYSDPKMSIDLGRRR